MTEGRRGGRFGVNGAGLVVSDVEVKWVVDAVGTADVLRHGSGGWLAMYASIVVDEDEDRGRISVVVEGVAVGSVDDGKSDDADGGMVADVERCGGAVAWRGEDFGVSDGEGGCWPAEGGGVAMGLVQPGVLRL